MGQLDGKVALVTGAARGMGAATARRFVAEGARVLICDVLEEEGRALAAELGEAARFQRHDVASEADWSAAREAALETFGRIDALVNNAGVLLFRTLQETTLEDYQKVLGVNLVGAFLGVRLIGAHMLERGSGSIINVSSADGMKAANGLGAYCSSKWGIRGLTRVAAMEYGYRGVRVNSVHPGGVDTAMGNPFSESREEVNKRYSMVPLQRVAEPDEVAQVNLFLASDAASYLCGSEIAVDGGMLTGQYYLGFPGAPGAE